MSDKETMVGFAAWHPDKGFDEFSYEGPVVFADLSEELMDEIALRNSELPGWRAVKVKIERVPE